MELHLPHGPAILEIEKCCHSLSGCVSLTIHRNYCLADVGKKELPYDIQWDCLETVSTMFEEFYEATVLASKSKTPTLTSVIPIYNLLIDALEDRIDMAETTLIQKEFGSAALAAKEKLLEYYNRTDASPFYLAALILDPRNKLAYFEKEKWAQKLIGSITTK